MFEKNMSALEKVAPHCAAAVRSADTDAQISVFPAKNGEPTAELRLEGAPAKAINSRHAPSSQSVRWVASFNAPEDAPRIALLGLGLGYHLESLTARFPAASFIVFEKRPALAKAALERADITELITSGRLELHTGLSADEAWRKAAAASGAPVFVHPVLGHAESDYYHPLARALKGSAPGRPLRVLSYMARGAALPHSLADCHDAFRELGHEVLVCDLTGATRELEKVDAARHTAFDFAPDLIFTIDVVGLVPEVHGRLGVPIVSWFFDNPLSFLEGRGTGREAVVHYIEDLGENYHIFSWDREYLSELCERGAKHAEYLPFAANPKIFKQIPPGDERIGAHACNISFAGNSGAHDGGYRKSAISSLSGLGVHVYGDEGWRAVADAGGVEYRGLISNREGLPFLYNASAININLTDAQLVTALPIRVFDIMACGGFLLSDYREDITRLFTAGKDLACVREEGGLRKAAEHYLANPDERNAIAAAGRDKVLAEHTFVKRIEQILKIVIRNR